MTERPSELRRARALRDVLEPYHMVVIFAPQAGEVFRNMGLHRPWGPYFAARTAPLGEVPPSVVDAVYYHFDPRLVHEEMPHVWAAATPEKVLATRLEAADAGLRALLGDEVLRSAGIAEAAELAVEAVAACPPAGRPLGAANAALPVPDEPHLALWHAATVLREWRGDGHNAALLSAGLDAVEALVSIVATGRESRRWLLATRGWGEEVWEAGVQRLTERGLLAEDGELTAQGREVRDGVEDATDRLAVAPWRALGEERSRRLYELVAPLNAVLLEQLKVRMTIAAYPES
jgi:hypothetical protein